MRTEYRHLDHTPSVQEAAQGSQAAGPTGQVESNEDGNTAKAEKRQKTRQKVPQTFQLAERAGNST